MKAWWVSLAQRRMASVITARTGVPLAYTPLMLARSKERVLRSIGGSVKRVYKCFSCPWPRSVTRDA